MKSERLPDPRKLKRVAGPKVSKAAIHPTNVKVRITTYLSEDIYRWLKKEAESSGTPYQILLNQKLRQAYEEDIPNSLSERVRFLEKALRKLNAA